MRELKLTGKIKKLAEEFAQKLNDLYKEDLVSVTLYGSASSGEFVSERSNLNLLVVLKNTALNNLSAAISLVNNSRFKMIRPLFFTQEYINKSVDVFPIEFLDMKENYALLRGRDILKDLPIDLKNLRFQCEHELKAKLINLRQSFIRLNKDKAALRNILFKSFVSIMHILRNIIRIKGKQPHYLKQDFIKQLNGDLPINVDAWEKILAGKNKQIRLSGEEIERLYIAFVADLDNIAGFLDAT